MGGDFQMESETTFHLFLAFLIAAIVLLTIFMTFQQSNIIRSKKRFWLVLVGILLGAATIPMIYYGCMIIRIMNELGGKD